MELETRGSWWRVGPNRHPCPCHPDACCKRTHARGRSCGRQSRSREEVAEAPAAPEPVPMRHQAYGAHRHAASTAPHLRAITSSAPNACSTRMHCELMPSPRCPCLRAQHKQRSVARAHCEHGMARPSASTPRHPALEGCCCEGRAAGGGRLLPTQLNCDTSVRKELPFCDLVLGGPFFDLVLWFGFGSGGGFKLQRAAVPARLRAH